MNLDDIKERINPLYADVIGTESYERRLLVEEIERLTATLGVAEATIEAVVEQRDELQQICRNAYEVYAGSEGIPEPVTAAEAYVGYLLNSMKDEIARGLK
jgi:hypothetical protein